MIYVMHRVYELVKAFDSKNVFICLLFTWESNINIRLYKTGYRNK